MTAHLCLCCSEVPPKPKCKLIRSNCRGQHGPAKETCSTASLPTPPHALRCIKISFYHYFLLLILSTSLDYCSSFCNLYQRFSKQLWREHISLLRIAYIARYPQKEHLLWLAGTTEQNNESRSYPEEVGGDVVGKRIPSGTDVLLWQDEERKSLNALASAINPRLKIFS